MSKKKANSTNTVNQFYLEERCTLNKVLQIIGKRWVSEVLVLIQHDIGRFSQLKDCLDGISDNVLSTVLNELVKQELVEKKVFKETPLRVEYSITPSGQELTTRLHDLCDWGKKHIPYDVRIRPTFSKKMTA